ncbi:lysozyme [Gluconobacter frateurii M-2]|nr:lysozyme [Gluconobacter frateurii M-2]
MNEMAVVLATTLLKRPGFEGFRSKPYVCPAGCWTIGYGSRWLKDGKPVTAKTPPISEADAASLLLQSVTALDIALSRLVRVPLSDVQRAALLSWQYNVGTPAVESSTLLRKLNASCYVGAADELTRWNKATVKGNLVELAGLTTRRTFERDVFLGKQTIMGVSRAVV